MLRNATVQLAVWLSAAILAGAAAPASASFATACHLDFQLFCADVDPESPRSAIEACLRENRNHLTESCRAELDPNTVPKHPDRRAEAPLAVCTDDFKRLCPQVADRMAAARCVHNQWDALSDPCRGALEKIGSGRGKPPGSGASSSQRNPGSSRP